MTKIKKMLTVGGIVLAVGATSITTFAASIYKTPAEAAAGLSGKTVEQVVQEKTETGKTYGTIAKDAGKLDEFKAEAIQIKKDVLEKKVADGTLTREKADEIIKAVEENSANCDGTGSAKIGQEYGAGFGSATGGGMKNGGGQGQGGGMKNGGGQGMGRGQGSCISE
jgi:hypothetical protein